jgi:hypothetical protein
MLVAAIDEGVGDADGAGRLGGANPRSTLVRATDKKLPKVVEGSRGPSTPSQQYTPVSGPGKALDEMENKDFVLLWKMPSRDIIPPAGAFPRSEIWDFIRTMTARTTIL